MTLPSRRFLWMLLGALLVLAGCTDGGAPNRDRPGGPLYRSLGAGGDRVMVHRVDGDETSTAMKLRIGSGRATVYGSDLTPIGDVAWRRDGSPRVRVRFIKDVGWTTLPVQDGIWEWPAHVRVEETGRGWAVFGPDAEWLGRFDREGDAWRLHVDSDTYEVREGTAHLEVGRVSGPGEAVAAPTWRIAFGEVPISVALAVALEDLSPTEQVAVGVAVSIQADPSGDETFSDG